jgi:hypothetical protein
MAYGIEIYNADGSVLVTLDTRLARVHSRVTVPTIPANSSVTVSVPGLALDGTWFICSYATYYGIHTSMIAGGIRAQNYSNGSVAGHDVVIFRA